MHGETVKQSINQSIIEINLLVIIPGRLTPHDLSNW